MRFELEGSPHMKQNLAQKHELISQYQKSEDIKLDSMVWEMKNKETESWVQDGKLEYVFDDDEGYTQFTQLWNKEENIWNDSLKGKFSGNRKLLLFLSQ